MRNGSLLDYLKKGDGQHSRLPEQIDMAAQVNVIGVIFNQEKQICQFYLKFVT